MPVHVPPGPRSARRNGDSSSADEFGARAGKPVGRWDRLLNGRPQAVAQRESIERLSRGRALAQASAAPNRTGLPDGLKRSVEALSGLSMDNVRVHRNSSKPVQLRARAYAQGDNIHLAPGQDRHLPHELWHVVQQKQGRVPAIFRMNSGTRINDDAGLEREADSMGAKAMGARADPVPPSPGPSPAAGGRTHSVAQRSVEDDLQKSDQQWTHAYDEMAQIDEHYGEYAAKIRGLGAAPRAASAASSASSASSSGPTVAEKAAMGVAAWSDTFSNKVSASSLELRTAIARSADGNFSLLGSNNTTEPDIMTLRHAADSPDQQYNPKSSRDHEEIKHTTQGWGGVLEQFRKARFQLYGRSADNVEGYRITIGAPKWNPSATEVGEKTTEIESLMNASVRTLKYPRAKPGSTPGKFIVTVTYGPAGQAIEKEVPIPHGEPGRQSRAKQASSLAESSSAAPGKGSRRS